MGTHRRRARPAPGRHAGILAGLMLLTGAVVLMLAVTRADVGSSRLAAGATVPAPSAAASTAAAGGPLEGTWTGRLADPDTAPAEVRVTVGEPAGGVVVEVPAAGCTYRGAAPVPAAGGPAVVDVRADARPDGTRAAGCADTARVRLAEAGADGPATDRVRYELLSSCEGAVCAPRRADGVLTAWRPGS